MTGLPAPRTARRPGAARRRLAVPVAACAALVSLVAACGSAPSASTATPSGSAAPAATDASASGAPTGSSVATGAASDSASAAATSSTASAALKACMVLDVGGVDDRSFNQSAWAGMNAAKAANPGLSISYVSSGSQNDYTPNLTNETKQGCKTTIAVGGVLGDAVSAIATANPATDYAIIDGNIAAPNVYSMEFNTAQGGFLGGYLAAGMTKSGKVGTFGGVKIPPVTVYMDGFWEGVQYYNTVKGKDVKVLGWDEATQNGTFSNSFTDSGAGSTAARTLAQQGADIVFPVAGGSGLGAGAVAQSSGGKLDLIWVDTDGCVSAAQYCKYFISTVFKDIPTAVEKYLAEAAKGTRTGASVGTLANKGTGLSPFHEFDSKVPADLKAELTKLSSDIVAGTVKVTSKAQPAG